MNVTYGLRRALQLNPGGRATTFGTRHRNWGETGERVGRLAAGLRGLGVEPGGRVAVLALNSDRYLEAYLGWMHTGDRGVLDADGFLTVVDRIKDMIITGGENVYSVEVENAIAQHPDVAQCAVIGTPSEQSGEQVHAVIVPRPDAAPTAEQVLAFCRTLLGGFKCPRSVDIRNSPLPLSGAGKVLKRELRAPFWDRHERRVG